MPLREHGKMPTLAHEAGRMRPANNAVYLAAANLGAKVCSLAFVLLATRTLGPALYGNFTQAYAFVGLFAFLTDLGLGTLAIRDVMADRTLAVRYVSNLLVLRLLFSAVVVLVIILLAQVAIAVALRTAVYVVALSLIPSAVSGTLELTFRFREQMAYSAAYNLATAVLAVVLRVCLLLAGYHVLALVLAQTGVIALGTLVMAWLVYTRFLPWRLELEPRSWPLLLRRSAPFVLLTVLNILYARADMQLLYGLSHCSSAVGNTGCAPVGLYSVAYQPLDVLNTVFVLSSAAAMFPAFTRIGAESREALARVARASITLMLAFGMPVALFGTFYAREALYVLGDRAYVVAAPTLAVLIWAFPCFLVLAVLYNALWAVHRQGFVTAAFAVTLVFNVTGNLLLIPHYSYMASSVLTVASEILNAIIVVPVAWRNIGPLGLSSAAVKMGIVVAVAAVVLWAVRGHGIFVGLPLGIVVVLVGLRLTHMLGTIEHEVLGRLPIVGRYAALL
jgi:O-antigen/teichoic acid export membrane protein